MISVFRDDHDELPGRTAYRSRQTDVEFYADTDDICPDCSTPSLDIEFDGTSATGLALCHDETCPVMQGVEVAVHHLG